LTAFVPGYEKTGTRLLPPEDWIKYVREAETTYAEAFRDAGFATFHVGKWHADSDYVGERSPEKHGFGTVHAGSNPWKENQEDPHHLIEYTEALGEFIREHADQRFLAVLSMDQVHVPIYENPEWVARFEDKPGSRGQSNPVMAAMVARMDWSVGRILALLEELDLSDSTAVVFFSDNGGLLRFQDRETGEIESITSNAPFRGGKGTCYEGGIRVPLIVRWPGVTPPGSVCTVPVISNDLFPTFLSMAGLPPMPGQHLDGLDLTPLLRGDAELPRNTLYWHYPHYHHLPPHSAVRHENWKLLRFYEDDTVELYDLAADPGETTDLATARPAVARQLRTWLAGHLRAVDAPMPRPNAGYDPSVDWRQDWTMGEPDPYEGNEEEDPRRYPTDPGKDYGSQKKLKKPPQPESNRP
jgi:uncharacterized sulfatase